MSYILDALKKLEHEKSRKSRRDGMINISGALLENERRRPSGPAGWKIVLAVTVAVLVTFGATWLLLQPGKAGKNPVPRPVPQAVPAPAAPQAPVVAVPPAPVQQTPPAAPPAAAAQSTAVKPPAAPERPVNAAVQVAPATDDDEGERASRRRMRDRKGQAVPVPAEQAVAAPGEIKLSGIAWQEERRARRAVVNGFLMQEGAVVAGARITDIFQDRVRFSLSGKTFEIPLISSAVPAAGK